MRRRDFLAYAACLAALRNGAHGAAVRAGHEQQRAESVAAYARRLLAGSDPTPFGRAYIRAHPDERTATVLAARLDDTLATHGALPIGDAIQRQVEADLRAHDVVIVAGWLLSRTEARLCALATLV